MVSERDRSPVGGPGDEGGSVVMSSYGISSVGAGGVPKRKASHSAWVCAGVMGSSVLGLEDEYRVLRIKRQAGWECGTFIS